GEDLTLTTLDQGALAVSRSGDSLIVVDGEDVTPIEAGVDLTGAEVPVRTVGNLVAVTLPRERLVTVLALDSTPPRPARFVVPDGVDLGVAVPYAGRIYVPDATHATVLVFTPDG